jgi:hypothetical protein
VHIETDGSCRGGHGNEPRNADVCGPDTHLHCATIASDDHEAASGATQLAMLRAPGENELREGHNTKEYMQKEKIDG